MVYREPWKSEISVRFATALMGVDGANNPMLGAARTSAASNESDQPEPRQAGGVEVAEKNRSAM